MLKVVFLDTNIFLHYRPFDQIIWTDILKVSELTIVIPPIIIRELNKQKELNPRPRIKNRASKVLKKLSSLFTSASQVNIRLGVKVCFEDRDPIIDFKKLQLNQEIQDDHLIASIIMFRSEMPEADIVLVTSDTGLILIGKARRHNIQVIQLPNILKLHEEPDQDQIRIRELEKKVHNLELKSPKVSLVFPNGSQRATFVLINPIEVTEDKIVEKIESIKQKYPKMEQSKQVSELHGQPASILKTIADIAAYSGNILSSEDIDRYNKELDEFYQAYSEYIQKGILYENLRCRTIKLSICIINDGTAPAEDVDVLLHFPNGFEIMDTQNFPGEPKPPDPPDTPRTQMQRMIEATRMPTEYFPSIISNIPNGILAPRNISTPNIKKTGSYDVEFNIQRIKHKLQETFDPLYILFDSFEAVQSFQINYRLLAANIPEEVTGRLHVIIEKDSDS